MKIKHFAGYGCVLASKCKDSLPSMLHIRVEGNHERGLYREDAYDLYNWLVRRFDKNVPDYPEWIRSRPLIDIYPSWRSDPKLGSIETCDYYFHYGHA